MTKPEIIIAIVVIISLPILYSSLEGREQAGDSYGASSATLMDRIKDIQTEVGCERIDGIIGPETTRLVNEAVEAESQERAVETMEFYGAGDE